MIKKEKTEFVDRENVMNGIHQKFRKDFGRNEHAHDRQDTA